MSNIQVIEGDFIQPTGKKIALLVARFNSFIVDSLQAGAIDALRRQGVKDEQIVIVKVPGAYEMPLAAQKLAESGEYAAVVTLGAVIRGGTAHFDFVAGEAAKGMGQVSLKTGVPVIFGVLTTDTIEQAIERAGTKAGNKGAEAAMTALEMINLLERV